MLIVTLKLATYINMYAYIIILYTVKSEIIEEQNKKFEDEMKTVEEQMQKLQKSSGNVQ